MGQRNLLIQRLLISQKFKGSITGFRSASTCSAAPAYSDTTRFKPLPRFCISSPIPRSVAHPSKTKTTKSNTQRSNVFFFIFDSKAERVFCSLNRPTFFARPTCWIETWSYSLFHHRPHLPLPSL